jgi:hypothetical protein
MFRNAKVITKNIDIDTGSLFIQKTSISEQSQLAF